MSNTGHASEHSVLRIESSQLKPRSQQSQRNQRIIAVACVVCVVLGGLLSVRVLDGVAASVAEEIVSTVDPTADDAPLRGASSSLTALGEAVVAGLAVEDREALAALLIDRRDFQGRLFDALSNHPAAAQMGPALLWDMQVREGADELDRALRQHGGRPLVLLSIEVDAVERRQGVVIHRRPRLRVVDRASGEVLTLQILGSVIEHVASDSFVLLTYRVRESS